MNATNNSGYKLLFSRAEMVRDLCATGRRATGSPRPKNQLGARTSFKVFLIQLPSDWMRLPT
ncbi:MAG: hypothetical protein LBI62_07255 [Candidatus Accumulibacter sp.]|jgi:hypothetical protein|nr:hypothetical protein [Accumulibacter sp.]